MTCADPESLSEGSNFDNVFYLVDEEGEDPNTLKVGHHWPASETPLNGV